MINTLVVQATSLIQSGDIIRAEALLTALVETQGDHALVEILDEMPPKDLLAVIREYDTSKQSVLSLLITPEQFARSVVLDRLYGDASHEHLRGMMNVVIFREDADANEFILAIADLEFGYETLADYLSDRAEEIVGISDTSEMHDASRAEISDHDWKELTWLLREEHPDVYTIVVGLLKTRIQEKLMADLEEAENDEEVNTVKTAESESKDDDDDAAI